jgi:hypothetical protein
LALSNPIGLFIEATQKCWSLSPEAQGEHYKEEDKDKDKDKDKGWSFFHF